MGAETDSEESRAQEQLLLRKTRLLYESSEFSFYIALGVALLLAWAMSEVRPALLVWIWFGAMLAKTTVRLLLSHHFRRTFDDTAASARRFERRFMYAVVVNGLIWGCAGLLLFPSTIYSGYQTLLVVAIAGMGVGSVLTLHIFRQHGVIFVLLSQPPIALSLMLQGGRVGMVEGVLVLFLAALLIRINLIFGRNIDRMILAEIGNERQTAKALREQEFLRLLLENIPSRVFWKDRNLQFIGGNDLFRRDAAVADGADLINLSDRQMPWGEGTDELLREEREMIDSGRGKLRHELRTNCSSGECRWLEISKVPIRSQQGDTEGILAIYDDISPRKRAEEAVRMAAIAFETHEAVAIADHRGRIMRVNRAFSEITGFSQAEVAGRTPYHLFGERNERTTFHKAWRQLLSEGRWSGEVFKQRKSGEVFVALLTTTAVHGNDGRVLNYVATFSDISDKKELERQLHHSQKMEAVGTLVGGIAHEFNNMLVGISGNIFLAQERAEGDPELQEALGVAESISFKAADMVRQLLTLARKDNATLQLQSLDLAGWLDEGLKLARSAIPASVELQLSVQDPELVIRGDKSRMQQILINLLNNGRDACIHREGPRLTLSLSGGTVDAAFRQRHRSFGGESFVCLSLADNGTGIPADKLSRIFEPFYTTKEVGKGTGLGLSVVQAQVQAQHGAIEVESVEGEGSIFRLYFPRLSGEQINAEKRQSEEKVVRGRGETILIADDEPDVLRINSLLLQGIGYKVVTAGNGREAIKRFRSDPQAIDLLLLDVVMPEMNGPQAALSMRALRPEVPLIFYTGYSRDEMVAELREQGSYRMIGKPIRIGEMSHLLRTMLDHSEKN